jgi:LmbE family N-acetylglucosaminyl deacetylase
MTQTLLAFLAHPDDESFGTGGTLAKYSAEGVAVHICIATDGVAGSVAEGHEESKAELVAVRERELDEAVRILGATLHRLNYRDSGMTGDPANDHPGAWINSDDDVATRRMVKLIREIRPNVVITNDETGGYYHPDHIRCWEIGTAAFYAAGNPDKYTDLGLEPFQSDRLYYTAFPNTLVKLFVWTMRLRGKDPTKIGRNEDIDLTKLGIPPKKIHARINYGNYWDVKREASAAHASQGGGQMGFNRWMPIWVQKKLLAKESYMRAFPPTPDGFREKDLFG